MTPRPEGSEYRKPAYRRWAALAFWCVFLCSCAGYDPDPQDVERAKADLCHAFESGSPIERVEAWNRFTQIDYEHFACARDRRRCGGQEVLWADPLEQACLERKIGDTSSEISSYCAGGPLTAEERERGMSDRHVKTGRIEEIRRMRIGTAFLTKFRECAVELGQKCEEICSLLRSDPDGGPVTAQELIEFCGLLDGFSTATPGDFAMAAMLILRIEFGSNREAERCLLSNERELLRDMQTICDGPVLDAGLFGKAADRWIDHCAGEAR